MQILVKDDFIITFVKVGGVKDGIQIDDSLVPRGFIEDFKPYKYMYIDKQISINENYTESDEHSIQPPTVNPTGADEELRSMFANLQVQIVDANTMIYEMSEQNARLAQEIVDIKTELNNNKGEWLYEITISDIWGY